MPKARVIALPVEKFTFEAEVFEPAEMLKTYDERKLSVALCLNFLQMSKVAGMEGSDTCPDNVIQVLIKDFEDRAEDFKALAVFFETTAARLTAVHHRLI
jgi:hypothetical protein